ncbi:MAG TPA: efflux RND transporter periplasmic adaptor subunit [Xanthobacteraceae bacterium]|nr:efflux RND transporter periplasmic adaptor subunit [Xanthobacteraceae bacterium]
MVGFPVRLFAVVLAAAALSACGEPQQASAPPPPKVTVAKPVSQTVSDYDEYVGRFVALDFVEVRARVSGYLDKIHFTDGQIVKQGDLLFTIDRRPFQNTLAQAQANLASARAALAFATLDLERGSSLLGRDIISQQTFDQRTQAKRIAEASVSAQEAAVAQAELDLQFTELRAPITGRIGDRRVSAGNLVTGGTGTTTLLATIVATDPIRFEFTFDESSYLRYERLAKSGNATDTKLARLPAKLKLIDEREFTHDGQMDFIDNVIERTTGTIRGRAQFANPKDLFTPGMFARIQIPGSAPYTALLVPDVAISTEQVRKFVYVVAADGTVGQKFVTLGQLSGPLRVIKEGIAADDRVIINGMVRARVGQKVTAEEGSATAPASANAAPNGSSAKTN